MKFNYHDKTALQPPHLLSSYPDRPSRGKGRRGVRFYLVTLVSRQTASEGIQSAAVVWKSLSSNLGLNDTIMLE